MPPISPTFIASAIALATIAAILPGRGQLRRGMLGAVSIWCQWLPIVAALFYMVIIGANLGPFAPGLQLQLPSVFSRAELLVMFLAGPLILTRAGNLIAISTMVYCAVALTMASNNIAYGPAVLLLASTLTVAAILADRMPWHRPATFGSPAQKVRDFSFIIVCVVSLGLTAIAILKVKGFGVWIRELFDYRIPPKSLFFFLSSVLLGWLGVILGFSRHTLLPLLCFPTFLVAAFLTKLPTHVLVVPFVAVVALSLASADHFYNLQRRSGPASF